MPLVSDLRAFVRVVCNLSGLCRGWRGRIASARPAEHVVLASTRGEPFTAEIHGEGRTIVLVHGLGGSRDDWRSTVRRLARTHRVVTLDLCGHGSRAASRQRPTLESLAGELRLVVDRLCPDRPVLVGHSLGALVVMQYLRDGGEASVSGVCFVDQSPCIANDDWGLGLFGSPTRAQLRQALDIARGALGVLGHLLAPALSIAESILHSDYRDVVGRLSSPALVVLGGSSHHYRGLPLASYYASTLRNGQVLTYPHSAHSPHRQEPDRFCADLAAFAALILDPPPRAAQR